MGATGSKIAKNIKDNGERERVLKADRITKLVAGLTHQPSNRSPVSVKLPRPEDADKFAVYHSGMFSEDECRALIELTKSLGYQKGSQSKGIPKATNVTLNSHTISQLLWERMRNHVPTEFKGRRVLSVDDKIRFLKYEPLDWRSKDAGIAKDSPLEWLAMSKYQLSGIVFLNDDFKGGNVVFPDSTLERPPTHISCPAGQVLLFEDSVTSKHLPVTKGAKYIMRIDFKTDADMDTSGDDLLAAEDAVGTMHKFSFNNMMDLPMFSPALGTMPSLPATMKDLDPNQGDQAKEYLTGVRPSRSSSQCSLPRSDCSHEPLVAADEMERGSFMQELNLEDGEFIVVPEPTEGLTRQYSGKVPMEQMLGAFPSLRSLEGEGRNLHSTYPSISDELL